MNVPVELRDGVRPNGPPLPALPRRAELALLARCLHREGYDDHVNGHVSWRQEDGTFLVDPRAVSWDRMRPDDIVRIDASGTVLDGRWGVTPALALHREVHRRRDDVHVIVHHHSRFGTVWAAAGRVPPAYDQQSALLEGGLVLATEYAGSVAGADAAALAAEGIGDAGSALLSHHGVLVTGRDPAHAFQRAVLLEWRCRVAWHVEALGGGAEPLPPEVEAELAQVYEGRGYPELFEAMAWRVIDDDPEPWQSPDSPEEVAR